jgi:hypothetical protein
MYMHVIFIMAAFFTGAYVYTVDVIHIPSVTVENMSPIICVPGTREESNMGERVYSAEGSNIWTSPVVEWGAISTLTEEKKPLSLQQCSAENLVISVPVTSKTLFLASLLASVIVVPPCVFCWTLYKIAQK